MLRDERRLRVKLLLLAPRSTQGVFDKESYLKKGRPISAE
jgi:hypothetical protein